MAQHWASKAPAETVERKWVAPVDHGDSATGFTASVLGATLLSSVRNGETITLRLSAGVNGETAIASLTATTAKGMTIAEAFYLPIRDVDNAYSETVGDVVAYALRPVVGIGNTADAAEQEDAIEALGMMLAEWADTGADIGVRAPPLASDVIYALDADVAAMKSNLRVRLCEQYGVEVKQTDAIAAIRGLQRIKDRLLPDERKATYF